MTDRIYLDWPDSPGLWWCSVRGSQMFVEFVGGELQVLDSFSNFNDPDWKLSDYRWRCRNDWHKHSRFTKAVLEPNPFTKTSNA